MIHARILVLASQYPYYFTATIVRAGVFVGGVRNAVAYFRQMMFSETPYKIAFYFTAVTVRRGTTSVDGVQNFPTSMWRSLIFTRPSFLICDLSKHQITYLNIRERPYRVSPF